MKTYLLLLFTVFIYLTTNANLQTYVGSTPAHAEVRNFLQISLTDSIDFIRWKLAINGEEFEISAKYGLSKPGTPGFSNGQTVAFKGQLSQSQHHYTLISNGKNISLLEVNQNVLHFLDRNGHMLIGNGGYSYALNNIEPVKTNEYNIRFAQTAIQSPLVFEGRTPCQELAALLGLDKSEACNKMKWYFLLYTDSVTNKPSHFLMGGMGYRKETMARGSWQITTAKNGRMMYKLHLGKWSRPLNLLKGDENILFFIDANDRLFIGNEDFSYTLNRRKTEYPPVKR